MGPFYRASTTNTYGTHTCMIDNRPVAGVCVSGGSLGQRLRRVIDTEYKSYSSMVGYSTKVHFFPK